MTAPSGLLLYCYRCGHAWTPRAEERPRRCPRCHSSRWDVPVARTCVCRVCGGEYRMESPDDPCPLCGSRQDARTQPALLHCNQCDYEWKPRKDALPKKCPLCRSAEWNEPKADRLMCQQCGHVWRRQSSSPDRCPRCQSRNWDKPLRAVRCQRCGHVWRMRRTRSEGAASVCPACRTRRWNEPMVLSRAEDRDSARYVECMNPSSARYLMTCSGCGRRWYETDVQGCSCPGCGMPVSYPDRVSSTSMILWTDGRRKLVYTVENGYGCVYLWADGAPEACRYIHEVLPELGMTIGEVVDAVNSGAMGERLEGMAVRMHEGRNEYLRYVDYFRKRLSLGERDAIILSLHFTGMGPEAIAMNLGISGEEVSDAFERIMASYSDSGILVDDTIFTEDPFRYYRATEILN